MGKSYPIKKIKDGTIVALFDKTKADIFCPHFYEIKYANGCNFDCQWCYLNGTYRFEKGNKKKVPSMKDLDKTMAHLEEALTTISPARMFNAGEVSDGMLRPGRMFGDIVPMFKKYYPQRGHKVLILTKSNQSFSSLVRLKAQDCVVLAWSINAVYPAHYYELKAPHPIDRLKIAKHMSDQGYEVRLRLDPMVPVSNWREGYRNIIEKMIEMVPKCTVITIGSLRGLKSTIDAGHKLGNDLSWTKYLTDRSSWGLRSPEHIRVEMYSYVIEHLEKLGYDGHIALCKETRPVWKKVGLNYKNAVCNCILDTQAEPKVQTLNIKGTTKDPKGSNTIAINSSIDVSISGQPVGKKEKGSPTPPSKEKDLPTPAEPDESVSEKQTREANERILEVLNEPIVHFKMKTNLGSLCGVKGTSRTSILGVTCQACLEAIDVATNDKTISPEDIKKIPVIHYIKKGSGSPVCGAPRVGNTSTTREKRVTCEECRAKTKED